MKIELELHDSREERPEKSCDVLVYLCNENGIYMATAVFYSKRYDRFNVHDFSPDGITSFTEDSDHYIYWAHLNYGEVKEAIKEAENPTETCRERLKREHPERRETSRECGNCGDVILGDGFYRINDETVKNPDVKPDYLCACCARRMTASELFDFIGVEPSAVEILTDYYQIQEESE